MQVRHGVNKIVFTPHFHFEEQTPEHFFEQRELAYQKLMLSSKKREIQFEAKLGAEVYFSIRLSKYDLSKFCIEKTNYLLIEFSPMYHYVALIEKVMFDLLSSGIVPIIAHIERYPFLMENPALLSEWVSQGVIVQVNANSLKGTKKTRKKIVKLLEWGLVHVVASDTHSVDLRPPNIWTGLESIEKYQNQLIEHAEKIFQGENLQKASPYMPHKRFGMWM